MNVLMCTPSKHGGVSDFCRLIAREISVDVDLFTVGSRYEDLTFISRTTRPLVDSYWMYYRLRTKAYDIVHFNPSLDFKAIVRDGVLLLIAAKAGVKSIVFIHGWDKTFQGLLARYFGGLFRLVYSRASAIIVLASTFRDVLLEMGLSRPIFLLTTAVSDDLFSESLEKHISSKNSSGVDMFVVLFLARMIREKGIYETLEAFRLLRSRMTNVHLVMAGDGVELEDAKGYALSIGLSEIEFVGHVRGKEKIQLMLRAHLYVLPTYGEGMPISVLEAMSVGLPVITCPVGGINDFFQEEEMGYLARTRDPVEISRLAEKILRDPSLRQQMSRFNREYARTHFRATQVARQIEQLYSTL